jgi:TadE-like protein
VEFALILPLFLMVLVGVIVLGIIVFYNQQLTNAAREAARFASVSSGTAQCGVVGHLDPVRVGLTSTDPLTGHTAAWAAPDPYTRCDVPPYWNQRMAPFARSKVFGLNANAVNISACWSGYRTPMPNGKYDAPPPGTYAVQGTINSAWAQCTIGGVDPTSNPSAIACQSGLPTVDTASNISEGQGRVVANRVTVYACYQWAPPMAGFLLIPQTVTLRAVISEPIQRQQ